MATADAGPAEAGTPNVGVGEMPKGPP